MKTKTQPTLSNPGKTSRKKPSWMRNKAWVPDQHGAWGMLILPLLVGTFLATPKLSHLLLWVCAITGFLAFHAFSLWWKSRRQARFLTPSLTYTAGFALSALGLILWHPQLLHWWVAAPLGAIVLWRAWVKDERSLLARSSIILVACLLTPIGYDLGTDFARPFTDLSGFHPGMPIVSEQIAQQAPQINQLVSWWPGGALHTPTGWAWVWLCTAMLACYFIGTVPFVKTMIRERKSNMWLAGSIAYHIVALVLVAVLSSMYLVSWLLTVVWVILAGRAIAFPWWMRRTGRPVSPAVIGITEIVLSILVLGAVTA